MTTSTPPDEDYKEPPSLQKRLCDKCRSDLGENETCVCVPDVTAVPQGHLPPPPRPRSPTPSNSPREDENTGSVHNEDAKSEEVVQLRDLWGRIDVEECQWGGPETGAQTAQSSEVEIQTGQQPGEGSETQEPSSTTPPSAGEPLILSSSDGRMNLTLRNFLGAGSHGTVVSADWEEGYRQVAVKVSHKLFISELDCTEPGLRNLKNELDILKALKQSREARELGSNFFPELFKSWQDEKNVYFAMDLYPWNLEDLRWADPNWDATVGDKLLWTAEMVCFRLPSASLSYSPFPADPRCSGSPSHANLTPRHQASQHLHLVHQAHGHR